MLLYLFYTMVQKKSKMTKNSNQGGGGSCLYCTGFALVYRVVRTFVFRTVVGIRTVRQQLRVHRIYKGAVKKNCTNSHKKRKLSFLWPLVQFVSPPLHLSSVRLP